jgi:outer membrane biosynthesis protein TonB
MVEGPGDTEPDEGGPEEGPILSPEELDITDKESVRQIDEGRFVVSPNSETEPKPDPEPETEPQPTRDRERSSERHSQTERRTQQPEPDRAQPAQPGPSASDRQEADLSEAVVHDWLRGRFEQRQSRYAFDVTATFDGSVSQRQMASNDVVTIFESLMLWYGQQIDSNTPVEEILGILLMESNVPIRYPPESVRNLVKSAGLSPEDSIRELLAAVEDDDGLKL